MSSLLLALALVVAYSPAPADAPHPADPRLTALATLDGEHPLALPTDADAWPAWRRGLDARLRVALGLLPEWPRTPLSPTIRGRVTRDGYTVERVSFEALPGFFVTGSLYRPTGGAGRRPAVLSPHGHWQDGRFHRADEATVARELASGAEVHEPNARHPLQARCAHLARMGCVVFHYDMVGYADSGQIGHGEGFRDAEAQLWAQSAMALQTWSSIRAVDFVTSLPDVDPRRVAATGASGGGTQTFVLAALDERVRAAVPAVMASTRMQGGCVCENAPHLRLGTSNVELCALIAPRPLFLIGADDWTVAIEERGLPELRALYRLLGAGAAIGGRCHPEFGHNYNRVSRADMYDFLGRHLELWPVAGDASAGEVPIVPLGVDELRVFDDANPRPARATDAAGVRRWMTEVSRAQQAAWIPRDEASLAGFRGVVGAALDVLVDREHLRGGAGRLEASRAWEVGGASFVEGALHHRGGAGVDVTLAIPARWNGAVVVVATDGERRALLPAGGEPAGVARGLLDRDAAVLALDPLGTGAPDDAPAVAVAREAWRHDRYAGYTYGYNPTLVAYRVQDVAAALDHAGALPGAASVRLLGLGRAGPWAALAAATAGKTAPARVAAEGLDRFVAVRDVEDEDFLPGAARWGGLPYFAALLAPTPTRWLGADAPPAVMTAAWSAAGAAGALRAAAALDPTALDFLAGYDDPAVGGP